MDEKSLSDIAALLDPAEDALSTRRPGVYSRMMEADDLSDLLVLLRPQAPFAIVERVDVLDFPAATEPLVPAMWPTGRVFGSDLELRWESSEGRYHVLLICNYALGATWVRSLDLTGYDCSLRRYYLWGPGDVALGRSMDYRAMPPGSDRPQLAVVEYQDATSGRFVLARYAGMQREGTR